MSGVNSVISIDGVISPAAEARIPVLDRGFLYGDSVYEVFRTYHGVPLFADAHFERLENSARLIGMRISQSRTELDDQIRRTVQASGAGAADDVYVRYQITRGSGAIDLYPDPDLVTRCVIIVKSLQPWDERLYRDGARMMIPRVRRNQVTALDPNIKGGNYLNNILAMREARGLGVDDSIILSDTGFVTEAANSNVWFVLNDTLVTPGTGNLRGLTRHAVHQALAAAGITSVERDVHVEELPGASECFISSATREVMPVRSLRLEDGRLVEFPAGGGPQARQAMRVFKAFIARYVEDHRDQALF